MLKNIELIDFTMSKGVISCVRKEVIGKAPHWHTYYEIELVEKGKGTHIINNETYEETAGDIFIMRLTDFHELQLKEKALHLAVEVPPGLLPDDIAKMMMLVDRNIITHLNDEDFKKAKAMYLMIEERENSNDVINELSKLHLTCALMLFILERVEKDISEKCSQTNIRLREIITYIQENLSSDLSITNIAKNFYVSKEYLCTFFKKNTGVTIFSYIRKVRLNRAVELLATTDKKIIEICELAGFNAMSTFMRDFKKEFGMSPSEMRQSSENQNNN